MLKIKAELSQTNITVNDLFTITLEMDIKDVT